MGKKISSRRKKLKGRKKKNFKKKGFRKKAVPYQTQKEIKVGSIKEGDQFKAVMVGGGGKKSLMSPKVEARKHGKRKTPGGGPESGRSLGSEKAQRLKTASRKTWKGVAKIAGEVPRANGSMKDPL